MPQATHCACRLPDAHGQRPLTRHPPSTGTAVPFGASDPAIQASGSAAQTSCCARSGNKAASHSQTLMRLATHAVDPHPCPISAITSMYVRMLVCDPPKRFGTIRRQRPLSRRAPTTSSGKRRSESVRRVALQHRSDRACPRDERVAIHSVARLCHSHCCLQDVPGLCAIV